ncbi:MAG: hypothetical protein AAFY56_12790, partial [Pseudomonadota bacterium]
MKFNRCIAGALLGLGVAAGSANAHHGFGGEYDRGAPIYLEGTVVSAYFGYPHAEVELSVDMTVQSVELRGNAREFTDGLTFWRDEFGASPEIEFPPVALFFELDSRIQVGDRIAIIALRNCGAPHQLRGQWVA